MNNKRINLAIIDQVWQTSAEACPVWCIHDYGGCSGGSCTCGNGMPCSSKYAYEYNLLVIQIKGSILWKLILHDHTYLQCHLLMSKCRISLLFSLPVVLLHLQVVLFVLPQLLLHLLFRIILLRAPAVSTTTQTPGQRSSPRLHLSWVH
jgi:hypothetical protein